MKRIRGSHLFVLAGLGYHVRDDLRTGRITAVAEATSFPGTIKQPFTGSNNPNSSNDWWQPMSQISSTTDDEGESSSDWDFDEQEFEEPLEFAFAAKAAGTSSSLPPSPSESRPPVSKQTPLSTPVTGSLAQNHDHSQDSAQDVTRNTPQQEASPPQRSQGSRPINDTSQESLQSRATESASSRNQNTRAPPNYNQSNKPLQTLEKLQQMLDETDGLNPTSQSRLPEEHSSSGGWSDDYDALMLSDAPPTPSRPMTAQQQRMNDDRQKRLRQSARHAANARSGGFFASNPTQTLQQYTQQAYRGMPPQPPQVPPYPPPPPQTPSQAAAAVEMQRIHEYYQQQLFVQEQQRRLGQMQLPSQTQGHSANYGPVHRLESTIASNFEEPSDTEDGLGFTLPNFPVYLSEDEGDSGRDMPTGSSREAALAAAQLAAGSNAAALDESPSPSSNYYRPNMIPPGYYSGNYAYNPQWYGQPNQYATVTPSAGPWPPQPVDQNPQQQYYAQLQLQQQQQRLAQQAHAAGSGSPSYLQRSTSPRIDGSNYVPRTSRSPTETSPYRTTTYDASKTLETTSNSKIQNKEAPNKGKSMIPSVFCFIFDSFPKLSVCGAFTAVLCYAAVSPRNLPFVEYNQMFYRNLRLAGLTAVVPFVLSVLVVDPKQNKMPHLVNAFAFAFTIGYCLIFVIEIAIATVLRLGVFAFMEKSVFDMTPEVPLLVVPWVLREHHHLVTPITLIVQDLCISTIACPLMEEFAKLRVLQATVPLQKNFRWIKKPSKRNPKRKKRVAESINSGSLTDESDQQSSEVTNVNSYISGMLAVSLGFKLADAIRRVCMYTHDSDTNKAFYSFFRGLFPIHELCGIVTALSLAKRDVLGQRMPMWKLLLPSAVIHGMANFRGKKPIFKWNSGSPWLEMQLFPNFETNGETTKELAIRYFPKIMWLILLFRVAGYCAKNYFMINRQAVKRATTYAGKPAAFSAELAAAEMLKTKKITRETKP